MDIVEIITIQCNECERNVDSITTICTTTISCISSHGPPEVSDIGCCYGSDAMWRVIDVTHPDPKDEDNE
jgi:hypothetical protein